LIGYIHDDDAGIEASQIPPPQRSPGAGGYKKNNQQSGQQNTQQSGQQTAQKRAYVVHAQPPQQVAAATPVNQYPTGYDDLVKSYQGPTYRPQTTNVNRGPSPGRKQSLGNIDGPVHVAVQAASGGFEKPTIPKLPIEQSLDRLPSPRDLAGKKPRFGLIPWNERCQAVLEVQTDLDINGRGPKKYLLACPNKAESGMSECTQCHNDMSKWSGVIVKF
jgi:hypothetical protein